MLEKHKILMQNAKKIEQNGMEIKPSGNIIPPIHSGDAFSLFKRLNRANHCSATMVERETPNPEFPFHDIDIMKNIEEIKQSWGVKELDFNSLPPRNLYNFVVIEYAHRPEWWDVCWCYKGGFIPTWEWHQVKDNVWQRTVIIPQESRYYEDDY